MFGGRLIWFFDVIYSFWLSTFYVLSNVKLINFNLNVIQNISHTFMLFLPVTNGPFNMFQKLQEILSLALLKISFLNKTLLDVLMELHFLFLNSILNEKSHLLEILLQNLLNIAARQRLRILNLWYDHICDLLEHLFITFQWIHSIQVMFLWRM